MGANDDLSEPYRRYIQYTMANDKFVNVGTCKTSGQEVQICYNTFGDPSHPCLLLIQGLGTSLLGYAPEFIEHFVRQKYFVIRYDNRDVGMSTSFDAAGSPAIIRFGLPTWASIGETMPYTLTDMMEDGMRLLTALGIERAHIFGMSMGGMLAQLMAIHYPERVLSLNLLFTNMGGRDTVEPGLLTYARFLKRPKSGSDEDRADHMTWFIEFLSQGQYRDADKDSLRRYIMAAYARDGNKNQRAVPRQVCAIMRCPSRREGLAKLNVPTVVMHGSLDPLIPIENGHRLAQTIPKAKLVVYPRLGHDFPPALFKDFADQILLNMQRA